MTSNTAVWLPVKRGAFSLGPAPMAHPQDDEILIRNRAVAINPIDWILQTVGDIIFPWLRYPAILGSDVSGEVVEIGRAVTRFKVGDRVLGHAVSADKERNNPAEGAFQTFTLVLERMASPIPESLPFEAAAVLPLGLSTAAAGLFQADFLALTPPSAHPVATGETVLVWGGSTSVGVNAIQLAVAAGYSVMATASPKNFDYLRGLGAAEMFDYRSATVVPDIVAALAGRTLAGSLAIGVGSASACVRIAGAANGPKRVAMATPPASFETVPRGSGRLAALVPVIGGMAASNLIMATRTAVQRVQMKFINGSSIKSNAVSRQIYQAFLPEALATGRYKIAPEPVVVGQGLDQIPAAIEQHRRGVSARKLVVLL